MIFFFFLLTHLTHLINADQITLKNQCDYKMFQHIQCNDLIINLSYQSDNIVSFISTTQQYCDQFKTNCELEQYYPRLSVIKEKYYKGILKSKENEDDDICMFFMSNSQEITNVNYNMTNICFDVHVNKLSITSILLISFSIFIVCVFIYIVYCKYKQSKKEINELKIQLRQFNDHNDDHRVHIIRNIDESV